MLENGPDRRRNLVAAIGALVQMTEFQLTRLVVIALRADEATFPAVPVRLFQTSLLCRVLLCPFKKFGKVLLHLKRILSRMLHQIVTLYYKTIFCNS